jgi:hypothetical protein
MVKALERFRRRFHFQVGRDKRYAAQGETGA